MSVDTSAQDRTPPLDPARVASPSAPAPAVGRSASAAVRNAKSDQNGASVVDPLVADPSVADPSVADPSVADPSVADAPPVVGVSEEQRSQLPSLSPSRAADFKTCPLLYRFRTIDRIPEPPTPDQARGTLVHAVLERLFDLPAAERTL